MTTVQMRLLRIVSQSVTDLKRIRKCMLNTATVGAGKDDICRIFYDYPLPAATV
jgi:hypothetical protein